MKAEPPPLRVGTPCPKQWEGMRGDAKRRYCEQCQLHVHNLSAMSARERERFVKEAQGACISYELRPDGTMVTPSFWAGVLQPFRRLHFAAMALLAALLPFSFTACASRRTTGVPMPPPSAKDSHVEKSGGVRTLGEAQPAPGAAKGNGAEHSSAVLLGRVAP